MFAHHKESINAFIADIRFFGPGNLPGLFYGRKGIKQKYCCQEENML